MSPKQSNYSLRSQAFITFTVPSPHTELGKKAFSYNAPYTWSKLQRNLKLCGLTELKEFKQILRTKEKRLLDGRSCSRCVIVTVFLVLVVFFQLADYMMCMF